MIRSPEAPMGKQAISAPKSQSARHRITTDDQEQSKLFIEKAHEIGVGEGKSAADELMKELANTPPDPHKSKSDNG
jgi:hypothetical protein